MIPTYELWNGVYIDLDAILEIHPFFTDYGGWGFPVLYRGKPDKQIHYQKKIDGLIDEAGERRSWYILREFNRSMEDYSVETVKFMEEQDKKTERTMRKRYKGLIEAWKQWQQYKHTIKI